MGRWRLAEKWGMMMKGEISHRTTPLLSKQFPCRVQEDNIIIQASILPSMEVADRVLELAEGQCLTKNGDFIAARLNADRSTDLFDRGAWHSLDAREISADVSILRHSEDLLAHIGNQLMLDYFLCHDRHIKAHGEHVRILGDRLVVEQDVTLYDCTLNTLEGPIILGRGSVVMEGCRLRGPLVIGENSVVKMGALIYGATSIGKDCKVGGEMKNVIFGDYSNKGHGGYIGDSVIGDWCNLGAGTTCSNMKNTYGEVRVWSINAAERRGTGRQFCGMFMGDHTKTAINTSFATGSVTGIFCNVLQPRPPSFVPSFAWGPGEEYDLDKLLEATNRAYERKGLNLDLDEELVIRSLYKQHIE